jgi:hypothetical protein
MPFGPITAPAIISPKRWGILILLSRIGANRITVRINKNSKTGLLMGKVVSNMFSINLQEFSKSKNQYYSFVL